jgi:hypothetical protein
MVGSRALAIEVSPFDSLVVFAGFEVDGSAGGLFYSHDRGANWDQLLLKASSVGNDVNVEDIVFTVEGSDSLAYVGTNGRSVYKLTKSGSTWTVAADMGPSGTSTGSTIVSRIIDLEDSVTGDTLFAVGTDYGINHPIAYFKDLTASPPLWTPLTTSGFPFVSGKQATAASVGGDTLFVGVDHEVYSFKAGDSSWSLGYSYPVGTEINMLFYDELLVGTGTGMYAHFNHGTATSTEPGPAEVPREVTLSQNYPNPFNPATVISYSLPRSARTSLVVFDALGRRVAQLVDGMQTAGAHRVNVDAADWAGGAYLYVLDVDGRAYTGTMVLVK